MSDRPPAAASKPPMRILITAGPTREYIDTVRYLSNDSSGRMGVAIAVAAQQRGHRVTLIHGPLQVAVPPELNTVSVVSAAEMLTACVDAWPQHDALIMAAAVADYRPAARLDHKHKKTATPLTLELAPTADILARLGREARPDQALIGFALEDRDPRAAAERKLQSKNLDAIVLNAPSAIAAASSSVEILERNGAWRSLPESDKALTAIHIVELAERCTAMKMRPRPDSV